MLVPGRVAAFENLRVRLPALADLGAQLGFNLFQGLAFDAADLRGLVLYAEQERVLVFDG